MHRAVQDVMTRNVVVASASTPFKELTRLLSAHRVGALPVVDDARRPVGVVSESDLALKELDQTGIERGTERAKAAGTIAAELMTAPAVVARPDTPIATAARIMHDQGVKHLPVVDRSGTLVGIVARSDLLKVFLRGDDDLRFEILDRLAGDRLHLRPGTVEVDVVDGAVTLRGTVPRRGQALALQQLASEVDGVVAVDNRVGFERDDVGVAAAAPA